MIEEMFNIEGDLTERQKKILAAAIESFAEKGLFCHVHKGNCPKSRSS